MDVALLTHYQRGVKIRLICSAHCKFHANGGCPHLRKFAKVPVIGHGDHDEVGAMLTRKRPTDRRAYPRCEFPPEESQRVTVGPLGFRRTNGVVVNISRGGVKVRLDRMVFGEGQGEECLLRFLDAGEELRPHTVIGIVRNVNEDRTERPFFTIEFGQPLELLGTWWPMFFALDTSP